MDDFFERATLVKAKLDRAVALAEQAAAGGDVSRTESLGREVAGHIEALHQIRIEQLEHYRPQPPNRRWWQFWRPA